ncbi:hypothetical protein NE686_17335 [Tissierella carlieri]|uniref:Uncharacterized protein n=1 Tax=Tissierella carlieri TaxID=689904 RepID=A0ABT1SEM8_9FIRM|nr:hypothetical protein [Tissierella carlieri]MCQ4924869.1 hypothetical protein [Tissierella carlieri]
MGKLKISNTIRELSDTSWLAQIVKDKMDVEFERNGNSTKARSYSVLHSIINEADDPDNHNIYYADMGYSGKGIVICDIRDTKALSEDYMRSMLLGMQSNYTNDDESYIISVLITHDLNSATIKSISDLLYAMN